MTDLTTHLPQDDRWMDDYAAHLGRDALAQYYDRVFLRLNSMQPGDAMSVGREVRPDNYDLFLKCAATAIRELHALEMGTWHIEEQGNLILRT